MATFTEWEKIGIRDFLKCQETNDLAMSLAKIISKNIITPKTLSGNVNNSKRSNSMLT